MKKIFLFNKIPVMFTNTAFIAFMALFSFLIMSFGCNKPQAKDSNEIAETRYPLKWPFASNSIWNSPIGDSAVYVKANLQSTMTLTVDEDIIVMTPYAPLMAIYKNFAGWNRNKDRCLKEGCVNQKYKCEKRKC